MREPRVYFDRLKGSNTNCVCMSIISIMTTFYGQDNARVGFIMMNNMVCVFTS